MQSLVIFIFFIAKHLVHSAFIFLRAIDESGLEFSRFPFFYFGTDTSRRQWFLCHIIGYDLNLVDSNNWKKNDDWGTVKSRNIGPLCSTRRGLTIQKELGGIAGKVRVHVAEGSLAGRASSSNVYPSNWKESGLWWPVRMRRSGKRWCVARAEGSTNEF